VQESSVIYGYVDRIESKYGVTFPEGRNPDVEFMAHLWEPLRWMHKPLVVYIFAECMGLATDCLLRVLGFRAYKHHNVSLSCSLHTYTSRSYQAYTLRWRWLCLHLIIVMLI